MTLTRLIGLYSPAPESGKTTIAGILSDYRYTIVPFATTLKQMVIPMLTALGYSHQRAWELVLWDKEVLIPEIGVNVRHMLQTLGTEYGRQCLHPNVWLTCWRKQAERSQNVVADDVRFSNEAQLVRDMGGQMWLVTKPGATRKTRHASEGGLDDFDFDCVIENDGTLDQLRTKVLAALDS
jgi:hypothetical protein